MVPFLPLSFMINNVHLVRNGTVFSRIVPAKQEKRANLTTINPFYGVNLYLLVLEH